jgi:phage-related baseplate assembly protein
VPDISFIENMSLTETEQQLRSEYLRIYKELTGKEGELPKADTKSLLIKAFAAIEYQTMQYIEAKGESELLKTSTGDALDALAAMFGIERQGSTRATATERFTLSEVRGDIVSIPAGTRVKTQGGKYFNTLEYVEIKPGDNYADIIVQAEEAGEASSGVIVGAINTLVDPIPYVASVTNLTESTGGLDIEDDDNLTERIYLAPSKFSCAGPKDAYEYYVREWRSDVGDVQIASPSPCVVALYVVLDNGNLLNQTEQESLVEYMSDETIRPLCDKVICEIPEEVEYRVELTYYISTSDQKSAATIRDAIDEAITDYGKWQRKLGRDINPTELITRIRQAGAKRVTLRSPEDIVISDTQLPKMIDTDIIYGGLEDD